MRERGEEEEEEWRRRRLEKTNKMKRKTSLSFFSSFSHLLTLFSRTPRHTSSGGSKTRTASSSIGRKAVSRETERESGKKKGSRNVRRRQLNVSVKAAAAFCSRLSTEQARLSERERFSRVDQDNERERKARSRRAGRETEECFFCGKEREHSSGPTFFFFLFFVVRLVDCLLFYRLPPPRGRSLSSLRERRR